MLESLLSLAGISNGDLIFFMRNRGGVTDFENAILSSDDEKQVFHVGLICNDDFSIVDTQPKPGVQIKSLYEAISEVGADQFEIHSVNTDKLIREKASEWAKARVGASYNDIFSPEAVSSTGREAYYCCQLIVKAYENAGIDDLCPPHKMSFTDSQGEVVPYWINYYKQKGLPVPLEAPGSHPSKLRKSRWLSLKLKKTMSMTKYLCPKSFDSCLHFIGGAQLSLTSKNKFRVVQPRNGDIITECFCADSEQVATVVLNASMVQPMWGNVPAQKKAEILRKTAATIRDHLEEIARWETIDCGKPIRESRDDIVACADTFDFFAGVAHNLAGSHFPMGDKYAYTQREPWGVIGAIGVWNYPMQTAAWKIAPALICGNAVVYKPSPLTPLTSVILAQILKFSGLPDGILSIVQGDAETGRTICENEGIKKVSFTGSCETGSKVLASCCRDGHIKPTTLELGGKSSLIIFPDADVQQAVAGAMMANFFCQGEVCTNATKVIVHESLYKEFRSRVIEKTRSLVVDDPLKEETQMGALISREHLLKVKSFLDDAREKGAQFLCGGNEVAVNGMDGGFYLEPTILEDVTKSMRVYTEEIFGPVMMLMPFNKTEEAISIANESPYGLAAGLFTKDLCLAYSLATKLQAGTVYVNTYNDINVMIPFGGSKQSGFGRENGLAALEAFSQVKSVFVNASGDLQNPFGKQ